MDNKETALQAGAPLPASLAADHVWMVDRIDRQLSMFDDASLWSVHARCVHCGHRVAFCAPGVPPCRLDAPAPPEASS